MSLAQSEYGVLTLKKAGFSSVVAQLRAVYNARQDKLWAVALQLYTQLSAIKPAQRQAALPVLCGITSPYHTYAGEVTIKGRAVALHSAYFTLRDELFRGKNGALTKPRQLAFSRLKQTDRTLNIAVTDAVQIKANDATLTITWSVGSGNRSVDCAHNTELVQAYMAVLQGYDWKRGEGGCFTVVEENLAEGEGCPRDITYTSRTFGKQHAMVRHAEKWG